ncbi:MAG: dTMP kinase [Candidatus Methylumidiphilus alinenensis]|uniref:Thymidylate kinase n=1 Tax=Candidatus Methylumidiphilus alinenensis TaxID=2202197 RepID=A0A2W4T0L9_9GAMM|nr:MAG: dTMP kinase [Candidatus Methylumidiphilus alinenensis]
MNKGCFITLEGGEGMGKTTNLVFIRDFLVSLGKRVIVTREPGGTPLGERIRDLFLTGGEIAPETELLLVFAARAQHLRDVIEPALASDAWVVCDRFTDASYAYQGGGRHVDSEFILNLEKMVQKGRKPDLTLLFDAPPEIGIARAKNRGVSDRMEAESLAFHSRVRNTYLLLAGLFPDRIRLVDASLPLENVQKAITTHLKSLCVP